VGSCLGNLVGERRACGPVGHYRADRDQFRYVNLESKDQKQTTNSENLFASTKLRTSFGIGFTETFSDNVDLDPKGQENAAILSDLNVSANLRTTSARVKSSWDGLFTLRFQTAGDDEGFSLLPDIAGFSKVEAVEDLFFVDISSSVSREILNRREADTESNRDTVQTYHVSPYLVNRFGGFASAELRYALDLVSSGDDAGGGADNEVSDTTAQTVSFDLNSGIDFQRLRWSITALASEVGRSAAGDISARGVELTTEYAVVRSFSLLGSLGYESFEEDQVNGVDFQGSTWRAGFRWRPGRRTDLEMTYGRRLDDENLDTRLTYDIGPRTRLTVSYNESLGTGGQRLVSDLSLLGVDDVTGLLVDLTTGLPFDPNGSPTSIADEVTRSKNFQAALTATRGRNSFSLNAIYRKQEQVRSLANPDDEKGFVFSVSWGRRLSRRTNFSFQGSFENTKFTLDDREDKEYSFSTNIDYNIFRNVNTFASYAYRRQDSTLDSEEYTENSISFGLRRTF
jgi:uncharacterized protein (PEP-CTERM system associated)